MADLQKLIDEAVNPALALLPVRMDTAAARVMLMAIGLQESALEHRYQIVDPRQPHIKGPARGLWQFERGGGVAGVMTHEASRGLASWLCYIRKELFEPRSVWMELEFDDVLAAAFARLLLWTDSKPLPAIGDVAGAWDCYLRNWRPGAPHPSAWPGNYAAARAAVGI